MTFEEWWKKTEKDEEIKNREVIYKNLAELLAHDAWKTAQKQQFVSDESARPKWTYCKDGMPDTKGNFLCIWNNGFYNVQQVCMYEKKIKMFITNTLFPVIAWMPLPEYKEQTK